MDGEQSTVKPGGLSFELILEEPKSQEKPTLESSPSLSSDLSMEDIQRKLQVC